MGRKPLTRSAAKQFKTAKFVRAHCLRPLKHYETPSLAQAKARVVALGDVIKDVGGKQTFFSDASSCPTNMSAIKTGIA